MPKQKQPWANNWKVINPIGEGGQGTTHKVQHKSSSELGCLKKLKNNTSKERRGRFRREVVSLQTLSHPSIPAVIEENTERFENEDRLYVISEFICGPTLSNYVSANKVSVEEAIKFTVKLLEILEFCHDQDVVHRDIKPDNIIVRDSDFLDPVLLDFGLSYTSTDIDVETANSQQLGNRFLHLPELQSLSSDKRSPVSDITQVCGLLFFMITGKQPVNLCDDRGEYPHQRPEILSSTLHTEDIGKRCLGVFDRGFQITVMDRWQSCKELRESLQRILSPMGNDEHGFDEFAKRLKANKNIQDTHRRNELFCNFHTAVGGVITNLKSDLPGIVTRTQRIPNKTVSWYFSLPNTSTQEVSVEFEFYTVGTEIVIFASSRSMEKTELHRLGLSTTNWDACMEKVKIFTKRTLQNGIDI